MFQRLGPVPVARTAAVSCSAVMLSAAAHLAALAGAAQLAGSARRAPPLPTAEQVTYLALTAGAAGASLLASGAADRRTGPAPPRRPARATVALPYAPPAEPAFLSGVPVPTAELAAPGPGTLSDAEADAGAAAGADGAGMRLDSVAPPPPLLFAFDYGGAGPVRPPRLRNLAEVQELFGRLYPSRLLARGIGGEVHLRFVIDANGRVDPFSIKVLYVTQREFGLVVLRMLGRLRFSPARHQGRDVPIVIEMPVSFRPGDAP